jgi:hypothetical protein
VFKARRVREEAERLRGQRDRELVAALIDSDTWPTDDAD